MIIEAVLTADVVMIPPLHRKPGLVTAVGTAATVVISSITRASRTFPEASQHVHATVSHFFGDLAITATV